MEMDSNTDSSMSIMDSNINSSARFLVQFHTENRPYREQFAEHHGSVADFDIETANPYLVEMHTSGFLSKLMRSKKSVPVKTVEEKRPNQISPLEFREKRNEAYRQQMRREEQEKQNSENLGFIHTIWSNWALQNL